MIFTLQNISVILQKFFVEKFAIISLLNLFYTLTAFNPAANHINFDAFMFSLFRTKQTAQYARQSSYLKASSD